MATASQRQGLANVKSLVEGVVGQRVIFDHIIDAMQEDIVYTVLAEQTALIMKSKGVYKEPKPVATVSPPEPAPVPESFPVTEEQITVPESIPEPVVEENKDPEIVSPGTHYENGKATKKKPTKKSTQVKKPTSTKKIPAKKGEKK